MLGLAQPDDRLHAPNEHFELANFFRGIDTSIWLLRFLAGQGRRHQGIR
jgi:acetylornithine deacetylase/succinyl-diaminopimelate desuccinylase-like protein